MEDFYIMQKKVDKSVLSQGFSIPAEFQNIFYKKIGFCLNHGESQTVPVSINGKSFEVKVINQGFDQKKYSDHPDVLQVRYDSKSLFIEVLRSIFRKTWDAVSQYSAKNGTVRGFKVKSGEEYLTLYAVDGSLFFVCLPSEEYQPGTLEIRMMSELTFEIATDDNAYIESKVGIRKIRHVSRAIGNSLKELYSYRCQICGEYIGERYGSNLIHAHHIDYFTKSLNNNPDNILILCPNHHGIIHDCNPVFDRKAKKYTYPNGYSEGLKLNKHIN